MDIKIAFGKVLRETRNLKGYSQERLALEAGIERSYVSRLENGTYQPSITMILGLACALGVRAGDLVNRVEDLVSEADG